ncbi:MAG: hypothetical protein DMG55_10970, partial [Acidobacteria bacterium]
ACGARATAYSSISCNKALALKKERYEKKEQPEPHWACEQQQSDGNNSSKAEGCKSILPKTVSLLLQALRSRRRSHVVENVSGDKNEFTGSCFGNGLGTLHHEIAIADEEYVVTARNFAVFPTPFLVSTSIS